ncbi:hypothetical protein [Paenibacillus chitinolyticus]|uniref:hypothetical protein n=1 Tax=Paenibacillus chitinolyticus TaxID=79263 RepID=UPI00366BDF8E
MKSRGLSYVTDYEGDNQWLYVDGKLVTSAHTISAESWISIIKNYKNFSDIRSFRLTEEFENRVDCDFNLVPVSFSEFLDTDIREY